MRAGSRLWGEKHAKVLLLFVLPRPVNLMRINPITHFFFSLLAEKDEVA